MFLLSALWWSVVVLVVQSCTTLCNPMDCSPPGSSVHGILQARILECPASEVRGGDERSYPESEVRGGGREELPHA